MGLGLGLGLGLDGRVRVRVRVGHLPEEVAGPVYLHPHLAAIGQRDDHVHAVAERRAHLVRVRVRI